MKTSVVLILIENEISAWKIATVKSAQRLPMQGESILKLSSADELFEAYSDLNERLRGDGEYPTEVHWILDKTSHPLWQLFQTKSKPTGERDIILQCFSWEWLSVRLGLQSKKVLAEPIQIESQLLPWLFNIDHEHECQQIQELRAQEHQTESARLAAERFSLLQENTQLAAQNSALQQVDAERLLSYLPALFARVFTVLGAADLALLCGRVEPFSIPNPYPEPSEETLRILQKQFRVLPRELQKQIVHFVSHLPQRQKLSPRSEMRELISELGGN